MNVLANLSSTYPGTTSSLLYSEPLSGTVDTGNVSSVLYCKILTMEEPVAYMSSAVQVDWFAHDGYAHGAGSLVLMTKSQLMGETSRQVYATMMPSGRIFSVFPEAYNKTMWFLTRESTGYYSLWVSSMGLTYTSMHTVVKPRYHAEMFQQEASYVWQSSYTGTLVHSCPVSDSLCAYSMRYYNDGNGVPGSGTSIFGTAYSGEVANTGTATAGGAPQLPEGLYRVDLTLSLVCGNQVPATGATLYIAGDNASVITVPVGSGESGRETVSLLRGFGGLGTIGSPDVQLIPTVNGNTMPGCTIDATCTIQQLPSQYTRRIHTV